MLRHMPWILAVVLLCSSFAVAQTSGDDLQKENQTLKARIAELERENAQLKAQLQVQTQKTAALEEEKVQQQQQLRQLFLASDYDPQADRTTVFTPSMKLKMVRGNGNDHWFTFSTSYPGKEPAQPVTEMKLVVTGWFTGDIYRDAKTVTLDIDGKTVECPVNDYSVNRRKIMAVKKTIDQSDTQLTTTIPMSAITAIGTASKVTGHIGHVQFELPREINEACKAMSHALAGQ